MVQLQPGARHGLRVAPADGYRFSSTAPSSVYVNLCRAAPSGVTRAGSTTFLMRAVLARLDAVEVALDHRPGRPGDVPGRAEDGPVDADTGPGLVVAQVLGQWPPVGANRNSSRSMKAIHRASSACSRCSARRPPAAGRLWASRGPRPRGPRPRPARRRGPAPPRVIDAPVVVQEEPLDAHQAVELDPLVQIGRLVFVDRADGQVVRRLARGGGASMATPCSVAQKSALRVALKTSAWTSSMSAAMSTESETRPPRSGRSPGARGIRRRAAGLTGCIDSSRSSSAKASQHERKALRVDREAKQRAERHHGEVVLRDQPGRGRFVPHLPGRQTAPRESPPCARARHGRV